MTNSAPDDRISIQPSSSGEPVSRRWIVWIAIGFLYFLITLLVTYPGIRFLSSRLMGWGDAWAWTWIFDWAYRSLILGTGNFWHPTTLFYPDGFSMAAGYDGLLATAISLPFTAIFRDPVPTFNVTLLIAFVTASLGMYGLALRLTRQPLAAFLAGLAFGFSPMMVARAPEHINLMFTGVLPLIALTTLRLIERQRLRDALWCGASLALAAFSSWYYGIIGGTLFVGLLLFAILTESNTRTRRTASLIGITLVVIALLTLPFALPFLSSVASGAVNPSNDAVANSADLTSFIVPHPRTNVGGSIGVALYREYEANVTESANYLGVIELFLVAVAFWRYRKSVAAWRWLFVALIGITFALGPLLTILGHYTFFDGRLKIVLPYNFFQLIPGAKLAWAPTRFTMLAHLGIAALLAILLADIFRRIPKRTIRLLLAVALGGLLLAERLTLPFITSEKPIRPFFETLGRDSSSYAVGILPVAATYAGGFVEMDYLQLIMGKPITEGYVNHTSLTPETTQFLREGPLAPFSCFPELDDAIYATDAVVVPKEQFIADLNETNLRYLVVYRWLLGHPQCTQAGERIRSFFADWMPMYEDDRFLVYQVPTAAPSDTR